MKLADRHLGALNAYGTARWYARDRSGETNVERTMCPECQRGVPVAIPLDADGLRRHPHCRRRKVGIKP